MPTRGLRLVCELSIHTFLLSPPKRISSGTTGWLFNCGTALKCRSGYAADMVTLQDNSWSDSQVAAHGLTMGEVREAVFEQPYWSAPGRVGTTLVYGLTRAGRHLLVVMVVEGEKAAIVTARDMKESWDDSYTGDEPPPWDIGRPQPLFVRLADRGRLVGRVLDAGCGTGEHAMLAASHGADARGMDLSPTAIAEASPRPPRVAWM